MKKTLLALFGAACCCAFAALKPGYVRHGDLKPADQVPKEMDVVISNYLSSAGYVPSVTTNVEYVVSNVTTHETHWITNNFVDAKTYNVTNNFYEVTNRTEYVTKQVTNEVFNVQTFNYEYWHTNNFVIVTNRYFYDTFVTTNRIVDAKETHYTNNFYEVTNRYFNSYFTNTLVNVYYNYETNYVNNVISNFNTHEDHWITNNVVLNVTNNTHEVHNVTNNFYDTVYETTNLYFVTSVTNNVYQRVHVTNDVTTVSNVTINVSSVTNWYNDRIMFTNGTERFVIQANNKKYSRYRYGETTNTSSSTAWTDQYGAIGHRWSTALTPLVPIQSPTDHPGADDVYRPLAHLYVPTLLSMGCAEGEYDQFWKAGSGDDEIRIYGVLTPVRYVYSGESWGGATADVAYTELALRVTGGYEVRSGSTTTNYVSATTVPGVGDYMMSILPWSDYNTVNGDSTSTAELFPDGSGQHRFYAFNKLPCVVRPQTGQFWYATNLFATAVRSASRKWINSGNPSWTPYYVQSTTNMTTVTGHWTPYESELVDFNELYDYGSLYTAEDIVTNKWFQDRLDQAMDDAMKDYVDASYVNATNAAEAARIANESITYASNTLATVTNQVAAAVTNVINGVNEAVDSAEFARDAAIAAANSANAAVSGAQQAAADAKFQYDMIQSFTNWFYTAVNDGSIITNMSVHVYTDGVARAALTITNGYVKTIDANTGRFTALSGSLGGSKSGDLATQAELDAVRPKFMSDLEGCVTGGHVVSYDVYFDTAGKVQGSFKVNFDKYTIVSATGGTLDGARSYEVFDVTAGPNTSTKYGQLTGAYYFWKESTGVGSIELRSTSLYERVYDFTQTGDPVTQYYGKEWSVLKTSDVTTPLAYDESAAVSAGLDPLQGFVQALVELKYGVTTNSPVATQSDLADATGSLSDSLAALGADVTNRTDTLTTNLNTISGSVSSLKSDMDSEIDVLTTNLTYVSNQVVSLNKSLTSLKSTVTSQGKTLTSQGTKISTLETNVSSLQTTVNNLSSRVSALETWKTKVTDVLAYVIPEAKVTVTNVYFGYVWTGSGNSVSCNSYTGGANMIVDAWSASPSISRQSSNISGTYKMDAKKFSITDITLYLGTADTDVATGSKMFYTLTMDGESHRDFVYLGKSLDDIKDGGSFQFSVVNYSNSSTWKPNVYYVTEGTESAPTAATYRYYSTYMAYRLDCTIEVEPITLP